MTNSQTSSNAARTVAVTGATGFVGRALVPRLMEAGYAVRRLGRHPETFNTVEGVDDRRFDLDDERPDAAALVGVDTIFYLVHAMSGGGGFAARDRAYAQRFVGAARTAGVRHVIYLGGLYPKGTALSQHLASRREVGDILRRGCGALHVRAGIILGAGSASFEMMCDLVRRLPVMVTPRWVGNRCQAVELTDAIAALVRAVDVPGNREIDLAGPDVLTYREMLQRMALAMGLRRRLIIGVPVLTPRLSARWLRFVTSVPLPVAHALVESLRHDALADGPDLFAEVSLVPCGFDEAVRRALADRAHIVHVAYTAFWDGRRYHLTQRFHLSVTTRCDSRLIGRVDEELHQLTPRLAPGVLRWHGDELRLAGWALLRLAGWALLRLGSPVHDAATLQRTIDGGWLVAAPGGALSFSCQPSSAGPVIEARLSGYSPRLPRRAYVLVQGPVHRTLVTSAVRRAVDS